MAIKIHPSIAVHPGHWLQSEIVEPYKLTIKAVADHFGVSRQAMSALFNGRAALTAAMAIRFEKAFGINAETLLRMQARFDLSQALEHEKGLEIGPMGMAA